MARAKRTDRAEARRRHRAQLAELDADAQLEEASSSTSPSATRPAERGAEPPPPPGRPSLGYAFRTSFRPAHVREDLAYVPTLVLGTKAVWLPSLLAIGAGVGIVVGGPNPLTILFFQYFAYVLPVGSLFLAGFLAPRASYFAGFIVGLVATAVLAATLATGRLGEGLGSDLGLTLVVEGLLFSTFGGSVVAAAAAWYKRFLRLANPNRGTRPRPGARGRQPVRRR